MAPSGIETETFRLVAPPSIPEDVILYYILREHTYVKDQLFVRYAVTDDFPNVTY